MTLTAAIAEEYFQTAYGMFQHAVRESRDLITRDYSIAGLRVRIQFANSAFASFMTPALDHLRADSPAQSPQLTICAWDSATTRTPMPAPPWAIEDYDLRGEIRGFSDGTIYAAFHLEGCILNLAHRRTHTAIYWVRNLAEIPYYERGAPFRSIIAWWLREHQRQLLHAGAVGFPNGGALLVGKGGTGKSNTALACLDSNLSYLSDDYCIVSLSPQPIAYSIYSTGKINPADVHRLPFLAARMSNSDRLSTEKALYFLNAEYPNKLARQLPLRAILIPRINGTETTIEKTSPVAGLLAAAPSTTAQLPYAGGEVMETLSELVRRVPCYHLNLGTDARQTVRVIEDHLTHLIHTSSE